MMGRNQHGRSCSHMQSLHSVAGVEDDFRLLVRWAVLTLNGPTSDAMN